MNDDKPQLKYGGEKQETNTVEPARRAALRRSSASDYDQVYAFLHSGQYANAISVLKTILNRNPEDEGAAWLLAETVQKKMDADRFVSSPRYGVNDIYTDMNILPEPVQSRKHYWNKYPFRHPGAHLMGVGFFLLFSVYAYNELFNDSVILSPLVVPVAGVVGGICFLAGLSLTIQKYKRR